MFDLIYTSHQSATTAMSPRRPGGACASEPTISKKEQRVCTNCRCRIAVWDDFEDFGLVRAGWSFIMFDPLGYLRAD